MADLPYFKIESDATAIAAPGDLLWQKPHAHAKGAVDSCYKIEQGQVILTSWLGRLHCIIYQTPLEVVSDRERRNAELFEHYSDGLAWREILDNGFGKTYRRGDMKRFALWSYVKDYNTFGSMDFHGVMWR